MDWASAGVGLLLGLLLGRWWAGSMFWWYIRSKRPDAVGFRTGIHLGDGMYYVVSGDEYRELLENEYRRRA